MSKSPGDIPVADAEIAAEIADHLATAAEQLQAAGKSEADAQEQAQAQFGDPQMVARRCYWIKQGDAIVFRAAIIGLLALLCVGLGVTTITSYRSQHAMADRLAALADELHALAEQQRAATTTAAVAAAPDEKTLEITGRAFRAAANRPASFHEIKVCKTTNGEVVRRIVTESNGRFVSGPLSADDYYLLTSEAAESPRVEIQWGPILVYPGSPLSPLELDVSFPAGRLAIETSRPLPAFEINTQKFETGLFIKVQKPRLRAEAWQASAPAPAAWPIFISRVSLPNLRQSASYPWLWFYETLTNEKIAAKLAGTQFVGDEGRLPAGDNLITAELLVRGIFPPRDQHANKNAKGGLGSGTFVQHDFRPNERPLRDFAYFGPSALQVPQPFETNEFAWAQTYLQYLKQEDERTHPSPPVPPSGRSRESPGRTLRLDEAFSRVDRPGATHVPIRAGCVTRIRIEIPDDLESRIQTASDATIANPENAATAWKENHLFREAAITVLDTVPQSASAAE